MTIATRGKCTESADARNVSPLHEFRRERRFWANGAKKDKTLRRFFGEMVLFSFFLGQKGRKHEFFLFEIDVRKSVAFVVSSNEHLSFVSATLGINTRIFYARNIFRSLP